MGFGTQFYPALREVATDQGGSEAADVSSAFDAFHVGFLLGVDLTLFRF